MEDVPSSDTDRHLNILYSAINTFRPEELLGNFLT